MKSGESHCNHELASDVRRGGGRRKEGRKEGRKDVMTSKNLATLTRQVGKTCKTSEWFAEEVVFNTTSKTPDTFFIFLAGETLLLPCL